jgi:nicotinamidase-related amidase
LRQSSTLVIAGEASSHCVRATTEHIVEHWGSNDFSRIVLLTDCMSPVAGFEAAHQTSCSACAQPVYAAKPAPALAYETNQPLAPWIKR